MLVVSHLVMTMPEQIQYLSAKQISFAVQSLYDFETRASIFYINILDNPFVETPLLGQLLINTTSLLCDCNIRCVIFYLPEAYLYRIQYYYYVLYMARLVSKLFC
jgi:hypothetical protein